MWSGVGASGGDISEAGTGAGRVNVKAILVLVGTVAFEAAPFFVPSFAGYDPAQFPVPVENPPVLPAGYAFALWGVIYLWLIIMAGFGVWKRGDDPAWDATRLPLIVSLAIGTVWLSVAVASPLWATVLIWAMLGTALLALLRTPESDLWLLRAPLGLYAGWLTAASCVSLGTVLTGYGIAPLGPEGWAIAVFCLALAIVAAILRARPSLLYGAAVVWALVAVFVRSGVSLVGVFAIGAALLVAALTLYRLKRFRSSR